MKAKDLRNAVLQLAVQGKLVPQDSDDEPASVLLDKIKEEKDKLIKEKKIKKQKPLLPVSDDEIPFDIPDSWEWVRLGEASNYGIKDSIKPTNIKDSTWVLELEDIEKNTSRLLNREFNITRKAKSTKNIFYNGDLLYGKLRPYLNKMIIADGDGVCTTEIMPFKLYSEGVMKYAACFLQAPSTNYIINNITHGMDMPRLGTENARGLPFPLPPIIEQQRIVERLEQIMPFIDEYEKLETELTQLETEFPEQLKKSILQYAVQGKLVEQNSDDEPASVLLEKIQAEKEKLLKEKKIKKQKPLAPITEEEITFDIPNSWEWVRIGEICEVNPRNALDDEMDASFIPMALIEDKYSNTHTSETRKWGKVKSGYTHFRESDIGIAKITPCFENKKSVIFSDLINGYGAGTTELHILRPYSDKINKEYILWLVKTEQFINDGTSTFTGTAGQQRIGKDFVQNYLLPLPPISEQKRIVERINDLFKLCDIISDEKALRARKIKKVIDNIVELPIDNDNDEEEIAIAARGDVGKSDIDKAEEMFENLWNE